MIRFIACTLILAAVISLATVVSGAQTASNQGEGTLSGIVVDWQNARVATTTILVENKTFSRRISVNEIGEFQTRLPVGRYRVTAEAPGFKKYRRRNVSIAKGATVSLQIKLKVIPQNFKCPPGRICL